MYELFLHHLSACPQYTTSLPHSNDSDGLWPFKLSWGVGHLLIFWLLKETLSFSSYVVQPLSGLNWIALLVVSAGNARAWPIGLSCCWVAVFLRLVACVLPGVNPTSVLSSPSQRQLTCPPLAFVWFNNPRCLNAMFAVYILTSIECRLAGRILRSKNIARPFRYTNSFTKTLN